MSFPCEYDLVTYPGFAYPDTHPSRLAAMAILHGLRPPPVHSCRVLEIGCNEGANLIPMAYAIPAGEFVGFDLAALPIERAQARIRELSLSNIRVFAKNLLDTGTELGQFDYVIAHGLYAWIPEAARDRLLALCRAHLAPSGVAFVSYNALPGGHIRNMIREMMLYAVQDVENAEDRAAKAIQFLRLLAEAKPAGSWPRPFLEEQLKQLQKRDPRAIYHDELSPIHHPVHFFEFVDHARRHGLQYLSESTLPPPSDPYFRSDLRAALELISGDDPIALEQLLDFVRMRVYRETLLCHADQKVSLEVSGGQWEELLFASPAASTSGERDEVKIYTLPGGIRMEGSHPDMILIMEQLLAAWPRALSLTEMGPLLSENGIFLDHELARILLQLAVSKMIELRAWKAPLAPVISAQPRASAVSRQEAATRSHATSLLHTTIALDDPIVRRFLQLLDGTRDRNALLEALHAHFPSQPKEKLVPAVEENLRLLHRAAFLEA